MSAKDWRDQNYTITKLDGTQAHIDEYIKEKSRSRFTPKRSKKNYMSRMEWFFFMNNKFSKHVMKRFTVIDGGQSKCLKGI